MRKIASMKKSSGFTLVELIVVISLCFFCAGLTLTGLEKAREMFHRAGCANSLRQIGLSLQAYSNQYNQVFPRVNYNANKPIQAVCDLSGNNADDPFNPKVGTAPKANNVPVEFWLLLSTENLNPSVMICPSTNNKPDPVTFGKGDVKKQANFSAPENLTYSIQNGYADWDSNFA